jgi:membrane protein DedA with SNARE-associated domain
MTESDVIAWAAQNIWLAYAAIAIFCMIEGEISVILAGVVVSHGYLSPQWVLAAAWGGTFAGDALTFWLGSRYGLRLLPLHGRMRHATEAVLGKVGRNHVVAVFLYRFLYAMRWPAGLAIGMSGVPYARLVAVAAVASAAWAAMLMGVGYAFGGLAGRLLGPEAGPLPAILLAGSSVLLVLLFVGLVARKALKDADPRP